MGYQSGYDGAVAVQGIANGLAAGAVNGLISSDGNNNFSAGTVDLTSEVTGILPVANGGTGNSTGKISASNITGVLTVLHGGTGNNEGYIRAGLKTGTTANQGTTAEGLDNRVSGAYCHAEGRGNSATANYSHVEGYQNTSSGLNSHSEGESNVSSGSDSHTEGTGNQATAGAAHAEGSGTIASANYSHSQNRGTVAASSSQSAMGKFNVEDNAGTYAVIVGNGTSSSARSNALTIDWSGNLVIAGHMTDGDGNLYIMATDAEVQAIIDDYLGG